MSRRSDFGRKTIAAQHALSSDRYVLYVRASTPEQVNSLDAQRKRAAEFASDKNLTIEETFVDQGVSAVHHGLRDRPEARRMFTYIKKHGISGILVLRLDRAFRSSLDFSLTVAEGLQEGFHFRFIHPDIDYGTPIGRMFAGMEALRAEMECALRAERVDDAYDSLRDRRIARTNQAPYGWRLGPPSDVLARVSREPLSTLVPIAAEQAVLRHLQSRWDAPGGKYGRLTELADQLNHLGIPTKVPAGTVIRRTYQKGTPQEHTERIVTDGRWKAANIKSVLAHAVLANDHELPDGLPSLEHAATILAASGPSNIAEPLPSHV